MKKQTTNVIVFVGVDISKDSLDIYRPDRVRDFAKGIGIDAKTDPIDAKVLSKYGEVVCPKPMAMKSEHEQKHGALVAIRHNEKIKAFYQHLKAQSKVSKVAIVACMRKFITILNLLVKTDQLWQNKTSV